MKQFIDKLIERLEEYKTKAYVTGFTNNPYELGACHAMDDAVKIVNLLAEEHKDDIQTIDVSELLGESGNDGWIPCSERLPDKKEYLKNDGRFIVTDGNRVYQSVFDIYSKVFRTSVFFTFGSYSYEEDKCVIAWQPLPQPYQPKGE